MFNKEYYQLRYNVRIDQPTRVETGYGGFGSTYSLYRNCQAHVTTKSTSQAFEQGQVRTVDEIEVVIRQVLGAALPRPNFRLTWKGETYTITAVMRLSDKYLKMTCKYENQ